MRAVFHEHRSHRRSGAVEQAPICTSDGSHPPPVWRGFRAKSRFPSAIGESLSRHEDSILDRHYTMYGSFGPK
jgi:hypothetical protein